MKEAVMVARDVRTWCAVIGLGSCAIAVHAQPAGCLLESETDRLEVTADEAFSEARFGFGADIDVSGDLAVIGFPEEGPGSDKFGAVYVYERQGGIWTNIKKISSPVATPQQIVRFGFSVAIDGDRIAVGSTGETCFSQDPCETTGVFIYDRGTNDWGDSPAFIPNICPNCDFDDGFGASVDLSGDRLVIGAPRFQTGPNPAPAIGAAFIYEYDGFVWQLEETLQNPDAQDGAWFGHDVSIDNDAVAIGAPRTTVDVDPTTQGKAEEDVGRVYMYRRDASDPSDPEYLLTTTLGSPDAGEDHLFGWSIDVKILTDTAARLAAGEPNNKSIGPFCENQFSGTAYVYDGTLLLSGESQWDAAAIIDDVGFSAGDVFGYYGVDVALTNTNVLVGRPRTSISPIPLDLTYCCTGHCGFDTIGLVADSLIYTVDNNNKWTASRALSASDIMNSNGEDIIDGATGHRVAIVGNTAFATDPTDTGSGVKQCFTIQTQTEGGAYTYDISPLPLSVDCDQNGFIDSCEIDNDPTLDQNPMNDVLDICETPPAGDCDGDSTPDYQQIGSYPSPLDCNQNLILDSCEIEENGSLDSIPAPDGNGVLDICEIDCDQNEINDNIDLLENPALDCNGDQVLDICQIGLDRNGNGLIDECEADCNNNGIPDYEDINSMTSTDCNQDGVPDECVPCPMEIVIVVDCSGSKDFACELVELAQHLKNTNGFNSTTVVRIYGTTCNAGGCAIGCENFTYDGAIADVFTDQVPCAMSPSSSGCAALGGASCPPPPGTPCDGCSEFIGEEDWAGAAAIVAQNYAWSAPGRIIIVASDEPPCAGNSIIDSADEYAVCNAVSVANENSVVIFGIDTTDDSNNTDTQPFMDAISCETGGKFYKPLVDEEGIDLSEFVSDELIVDINELDIQPTSDPCGCTYTQKCVGDTDCDNDVDSADLNAVLGYFGDRWPQFDLCDQNLNYDTVIDAADLNLVLGSFGCGVSGGSASATPLSGGAEPMPQEDYQMSLVLQAWAISQGFDTIQEWSSWLAQQSDADQSELVNSLKSFIDNWSS